jgi:large subunit ribosomal protein L3
MTIGLVGRKSGMTRVFTEDGASIPVTVVEITPNRVTQIKELDSDGYRAIQVTAGDRKASKVSKAEAGHFAKAGVRRATACGNSVLMAWTKLSRLARADR